MTAVTHVGHPTVAVPETVLAVMGAVAPTEPRPEVQVCADTTPDALVCKQPAVRLEIVRPVTETFAPLAMKPANEGSMEIMPEVMVAVPEGTRTVAMPIHPESAVGTAGVEDAVPALSW